MALHIGDQIKLLHGNETGIVQQVYPNGVALVLIDDVLDIEVEERDLIVLKTSHKEPDPKSLPQQSVGSSTTQAQPQIAQGLYFLLERPQEDKLVLWLYNHTDVAQVVGLFVAAEGSTTSKGLLHTSVGPGAAQLLVQFPFTSMEQYRQWYIIGFPFADKSTDTPKPFLINYKLVSKALLKAPMYISALRREAVLLGLAQEEMEVSIPAIEQAPSAELAPDLSNLVSELSTRRPRIHPKQEAFRPELPSREVPIVDLHIEKIAPLAPGLSPREILTIQLSHVDKSLDKALELGLPEVTFIHGVGKGVLRLEIEKRLRKSQRVGTYFLDETGQYGQGATKAILI